MDPHRPVARDQTVRVGRGGQGRTFPGLAGGLDQFLYVRFVERVTDSDAEARKEAAKIVAIVVSKRKT